MLIEPAGRRGGEAALLAQPRNRDRKLTVSLPPGVVRQLKARMAHEETTLRALVLEALATAGYAVPSGEIRDRRRREGA